MIYDRAKNIMPQPKRIQGIAYMNQCGQRNFHTVIFNVADMAGIDAGHIGDIFLGQAASDMSIS